MTDNVNRLLVVDDEPGIVDFVGALGRKLGYTVATTPSGVEFLRLVVHHQESVDVISHSRRHSDCAN